MTKLPLFAIVAGSALHLSCGDTAVNEPGLGGAAGSPAASGTGASLAGSSGSGGTGGNISGAGGTSAGGSGGASVADAGVPAPRAAEQPHHLGKPFTIVNGAISSNDHGLEASFYAVRDTEESPISLTSTTGKLCLNGEVARATTGDAAHYWGITFGFTTATSEFLTLTENGLSTSPDAPAWNLDGGRVVGIAFTVTGSVLPGRLGFSATPGGQDSGGQYGVAQELTIYGDCAAPPITLSGQVAKSFYADLENWWCIPEYKSRWTADRVVTFWWGINSLIVDDIIASGAVADPYDFCLEDIRPILAGSGPDEAGEPVRDAGSDGPSDAAASDAAADASP